jgi:hypothetical protein
VWTFRWIRWRQLRSFETLVSEERAGPRGVTTQQNTDSITASESSNFINPSVFTDTYKCRRLACHKSQLNSSLLYASVLFFVPLLPLLSHLPLPKVAFYSKRVILREALQFSPSRDGMWKVGGIRTNPNLPDRSVQLPSGNCYSFFLIPCAGNC